MEINVALVAALFAGLGIWLGLTLTRKKPTMIIKEIPAQAADPFVADQTRVSQLGITARETEILGLRAAWLSNREIAQRRRRRRVARIDHSVTIAKSHGCNLSVSPSRTEVLVRSSDPLPYV